nr:hypothetical protein [Tanacetum cinerariifolium]
DGHFTKDCRKAKVKDYNYYKKKMLLAKKDSDDQVFLAEDQIWMQITDSDSKEEPSTNMVCMAKMEKVPSNPEESSSFEKDTIAEVSYYFFDSESEYEFDDTLDYYDKSELNYGLFLDNDDDQEIFHDAIELASENFDENLLVSQNDHDELETDHNESEDTYHLVDK